MKTLNAHRASTERLLRQGRLSTASNLTAVERRVADRLNLTTRGTRRAFVVWVLQHREDLRRQSMGSFVRKLHDGVEFTFVMDQLASEIEAVGRFGRRTGCFLGPMFGNLNHNLLVDRLIAVTSDLKPEDFFDLDRMEIRRIHIPADETEVRALVRLSRVMSEGCDRNAIDRIRRGSFSTVRFVHDLCGLFERRMTFCRKITRSLFACECTAAWTQNHPRMPWPIRQIAAMIRRLEASGIPIDGRQSCGLREFGAPYGFLPVARQNPADPSDPLR